MPIKDMPLEERPREKASLYGLEHLSDAELLAIFVRSGGNESVLSLSSKLISEFGSLKKLSESNLNDLMKIKGIGKVKALELKALSEFSKRISQRENVLSKINTDEEAVLNFPSRFSEFKREQFIILSLDRTNKIVSWKQLYKGTESSVEVEPREVVSILIKEGASKFYCFHNHPSGNVEASDADIFLTKRIENHAAIFNIELLGHIVINENRDYKRIII